jgi:tetratricopeptide (TPR) repeat protein
VEPEPTANSGATATSSGVAANVRFQAVARHPQRPIWARSRQSLRLGFPGDRRGMNSSDWDSYDALGDALLWSGDAERSAKTFELAHQMNPRPNVGSLWDLATAYFLLGRNAEAVSTFERALTRDEKFSYAHYMLAAVYAEEAAPETLRSLPHGRGF